jgi:hypothetical protein
VFSLRTWYQRWIFRLVLGASALTLLGCAGDAQFKVTYLPGWPQKGVKISVFGIKRDGLMSRSGWDALNPELSAPFGARRCTVAYSEELFSTNSALAEALETYVRSNGVTDRLLKELSPAAQGDIILLVTSVGRPRTSGSDAAAPDVSPPQRRMGGGGGRRGVVRGVRPDAERSGADYQLTALFFSIREHQTIGIVELDYTGSSAEIALAELRTRLESEFPAATCRNWDWAVPIDANKLRKLESE